MMQLLGFRRFVILAAIGGVNLFLLALFFGLLSPAHDDTFLRLSNVQAQISDLTSRVQNVKQELEDFKKNLPQYEDLKSKGFFSEQNRFNIGRELDKLRKEAGIGGFAYDIDELKTVSIPELEAAGYKMIDSKITVSGFASLMDRPVYEFIGLMQTKYPMFLRFQSFSIRKEVDISDTVLETIASGVPQEITKAEAVFHWYTLQPVEDPNNPASAVGGVQ